MNLTPLPKFSSFAIILTFLGMAPQGAFGKPGAPEGSAAQKGIQNLADVEIKSICGFLDQQDINMLLRTSRLCRGAVKANDRTGLNSFQERRTDSLTIKTSDQLMRFLKHGTDHFYGRNLEVSIRSMHELDLLLANPHLQKSLESLILNFINPFKGAEYKESLAQLLAPFKNLTRVKFNIWRNRFPTTAFSLAEVDNSEAFKELLTREPKNLIITNYRNGTLAHEAAVQGSLGVIRHLAQLAPEMLKARDIVRNTPAHLAQSHCQWDVLKFIAQYAPEIMMLRNNLGNTPAYEAAENQKWDIVKFIAEVAPDSINLPDIMGDTVLDVAEQKGAPLELIQALQQIIENRSRTNK